MRERAGAPLVGLLSGVILDRRTRPRQSVTQDSGKMDEHFYKRVRGAESILFLRTSSVLTRT